MSWVDQHFPGGRPAFLALLSPPMRAFFSQTFLAIGMYDLPLASVAYACRCARYEIRPIRRDARRHQAKLDIGGVYRLLLKLTSARMIAGKLPGIMAKYFDFGATRALTDQPLCVTFEVASIPQMLVDWFFACYTGYVEIVVGAAGGQIPTLDFDASPAPDQHGFPASKIVGTVRWG